MGDFPPEVQRAIEELRALDREAEAGWPNGYDVGVVTRAATTDIDLIVGATPTLSLAAAAVVALQSRPAFRATVAPKKVRRA